MLSNSREGNWSMIYSKNIYNLAMNDTIARLFFNVGDVQQSQSHFWFLQEPPFQPPTLLQSLSHSLSSPDKPLHTLPKFRLCVLQGAFCATTSSAISKRTILFFLSNTPSDPIYKRKLGQWKLMYLDWILNQMHMLLLTKFSLINRTRGSIFSTLDC